MFEFLNNKTNYNDILEIEKRLWVNNWLREVYRNFTRVGFIFSHPFHCIIGSFYPIAVRGLIIFIVRSILITIKFSLGILLFPGTFVLSLNIFLWTQIIKKEGGSGFHTSNVKDNIKLGFIIFIFTEVILFISFFWAFFDRALSPTIEVGMVWTPYFLIPLNPFDLPLLNTALLLFSRVLLTWAHILFYNGEDISWILLWTIVIGLLFFYVQLVEYRRSSFGIRDSIFGRIFFWLTGLHGCHVILGALFLLFTLYWTWVGSYSLNNRVWLDLSALYWHFVDVVWFFVWSFLYLAVY